MILAGRVNRQPYLRRKAWFQRFLLGCLKTFRVVNVVDYSDKHEAAKSLLLILASLWPPVPLEVAINLYLRRSSIMGLDRICFTGNGQRCPMAGRQGAWGGVGESVMACPLEGLV